MNRFSIILTIYCGCFSELDYVGQTSWILFLKYLDDLEKLDKDNAQILKMIKGLV